MSVLDRYYDGAGRSGMRRYKQLARKWRHNTFGRWTSMIVWLVYVLTLVALLAWTSPRWRFGEGLVFGLFAAGFLMLPDATMPDYIARRQRGVWGEQLTARKLKPLRKQGWLVRHDLATGYGRGNRDHIVVGPAVYLLDSKLLKDEVWLDEAGLHVRRVEDPDDQYVVQGLSDRLRKAAGAVKRDLRKAVGFGVEVYPVVVIWGYFAAGVQWDGGVAYVDGDQLFEWLQTRPVDLLDERKRERVRGWLHALPRA